MRASLRVGPFWCLVWVALVAACSKPKVEITRIPVEEKPFSFPEVEGWTRSDPRPLPKESGGYSVAYDSVDMIAVTVYVYNRGLTHVPQDLSDEVLVNEINSAEAAIFEAERMQIYENVRLEKSGTWTLGGLKDAPQALYARFRIRIEDRENGSEIYVLPYQNQFIKIRVTRPAGGAATVPTSLNRLFEALSQLLSGSRTIKVAPKVTEKVEDLAAAREGFVTELRVRRPAPQGYRKLKPPAGSKLVEYTSGELKLKGLLSTNAEDGKKRPAVVFLHGGFAFGDGDWEDAEPFVQAGFVLFIPMLRGENGNPGSFESFYGEVDDAIAAGKFVSALPNVDAGNVFVSGHSAGGVLACLVAMLPSPFKASAPLDGYVDMQSWAAGSPAAFIPYDRNSPREVRLRNPMAFVESIRCPIRLYAGQDCWEVNAPLAAAARAAGKDCELVVVPGNHQAMVAPAVKKAIEWFQSLTSE